MQSETISSRIWNMTESICLECLRFNLSGLNLPGLSLFDDLFDLRQQINRHVRQKNWSD